MRRRPARSTRVRSSAASDVYKRQRAAHGRSSGRIVSVLIFEVALNNTSMFNHSNLRIPDRMDAALRMVLVTPDMHRVHHSTAVRETNSNFGFNLSWWDQILGTYCPQPAAGHKQMI